MSKTPVPSSHLALYRKYRPATWDDVLGQDHVVKVLKGSIKEGNIAHAYLFSGSRGTGKTTAARILAREIGCTDKDLYEIDAASNRGIDDIRALQEGVYTLPFDSPYKVYIIDEAHMLTKEAFNALLKTLEEPPSYVVFVLATTESEKLPETIVSRCQSFVFKKPSIQILREMVSRVAKEEGYTLEPASAELIAVLADGSYRDAHGILQKIISSSPDKKVSVEEVEAVTGAPSGKLVLDLIEALGKKDDAKALGIAGKAVGQGSDPEILITLLLHRLRTLLLLRHAPTLSEALKEEVSEGDFATLKELGEKYKESLTLNTLRLLLDAHLETRRAAVPQLPLEMAIIAACAQSR